MATIIMINSNSSVIIKNNENKNTKKCSMDGSNSEDDEESDGEDTLFMLQEMDLAQDDVDAVCMPDPWSKFDPWGMAKQNNSPTTTTT